MRSGVVEMETLYELLERANQIISAVGYPDMVEQMFDFIIEICGAEAGYFFLEDRKENGRPVAIYRGEDHLVAVMQRKSVFDSMHSAASDLNDVIIARWPEGDDEWPNPNPDGRGDFNSVLTCPIIMQNKNVGVVQLANCSTPAVDLVKLLCNRLAYEVEASKLLAAGEERQRRLEALVAIIEQISSILDRDQILPMIIDYGHKLLRTEAGSLFIIDQQTGDLVMYLSSNIDNLSEKAVRVPAGEGIIGHVVSTGESVIVDDVATDNRHYGMVDKQSDFRTRSVLAVPLRVRTVQLGSARGTVESHIIGGFEVINKIDGVFTSDDVDILQTLANQAATVMEIAQLYTESNELFINAIRALMTTIDAKDSYIEGHSQRVSEFSVAIAEELGCSAEEIYQIRIGSLLHDMGKIGIPDEILSKPDNLEPSEYEIMKQHPVIGANIMRQIKLLHAELLAVYDHHERLDGSGYPRGLKGDQISMFGKIVAVADVCDAMTSARPYEDALDMEEVISFLREGVGTKFDPKIVEALVCAYKKGYIRTQKQQ
jgi:putative nucleotidyltransferase with HDIG domain